MKAMIFAAGIGSRLQPLTDKIPKALVEVAGKTILQHSIKHLVSYGFTDIIINLHHFPDKIKQTLKENNNFGAQITFSEEYDELLDTGGGLNKAGWFFDEGSFLAYNGDILTNMNLNAFIHHHREKNALATLFVRERQSSRYLLFDEKNRLVGWENIKTGEKIITRNTDKYKRLAFSGIHAINPAIFDDLPQKDVFSIIEAYLHLSKQHDIIGFEDNQSYWFDIGNMEKLENARAFLNNLRPGK